MSITKDWKEPDLFDWLVSNIYPDLIDSRNKMSRWDCYSPESFHRIELKCRRTHYDELLLERKKYEAMLDECRKHLDIPVYINSTPLGIYSFNLLIVVPEWEINSKNPATTEFANTLRVEKEVTYLNINQATKLL